MHLHPSAGMGNRHKQIPDPYCAVSRPIGKCLVYLPIDTQKVYWDEMAQLVKMFATKDDGLSSNPRIHNIEG